MIKYTAINKKVFVISLMLLSFFTKTYSQDNEKFKIASDSCNRKGHIITKSKDNKLIGFPEIKGIPYFMWKYPKDANFRKPTLDKGIYNLDHGTYEVIIVDDDCCFVHETEIEVDHYDDCDDDDDDDDDDDGDGVYIPVFTGSDPNDITGPKGYGPEKWVSINDKLDYKIRFENDPEFATAPVHRIIVKLSVDENLDLYSFRLNNYGFRNYIYSVPAGRNHYSERLDLKDSLGIFVDFIAGIDVTKREAFWIFQTIDANTGMPPEDPFMGFLPINDTISHNGEGFVTFSLYPDKTCITGDSVTAQADIYFDVNDAVATNVAFNTIDALPPKSSITQVTHDTENKRINIQWQGSDDINGSGVRHYDLYVSDNDEPFYLYQPEIIDSSITFSGERGFEYKFLITASDNTFNKENLDLTGDTTLQILFQDFFVKPASGDIFCEGGDIAVEWIKNEIYQFELQISADSGKTYQDLGPYLYAEDLKANIPIPNILEGNKDYILRAIDVYTNQIIDTSEYFYISETMQVELDEEFLLCNNDSVDLNSIIEIISSQPYVLDWMIDEDTLDYTIVSEEEDYIANVTNTYGCHVTDTIYISNYLFGEESEFPGIYFWLTEFCLNEAPGILNGEPAGGIFEGPGIVDGFFHPEIAGIGEHEIKYTIESENGCIDSTLGYVLVYPIPEVTLETEHSTYCIASEPVTLTGLPYGGWYTGTGVSDSTFYPDSAGIGIHKLYYTYKDSVLCAVTDSIEVTVYELNAEIQNLNESYCINDAPVSITLEPEGGILEGNGIEGDTFNPAQAGEGIHDIKYTYTDAFGCTDDTTVQVNVLSQPALSLGKDTTIDHNQNILLDAGEGFTSYLWSNGSIHQTLMVEGTVAGVGTHQYWVMVTNEHSCQNTDTINITVNNQTDIELFNSLSIVKFYPNPNLGEFYLEVKNHEVNDIVITITNPLGREVLIRKYENNKTHIIDLIDLTGEPQGIYLIKVRMNELIKVEKLIIS